MHVSGAGGWAVGGLAVWIWVARGGDARRGGRSGSSADLPLFAARTSLSGLAAGLAPPAPGFAPWVSFCRPFNSRRSQLAGQRNPSPTFQSISVQTHQSLMLIEFNFAKIWKHPDRLPLAAFSCSTVSQLWVKTQLVRTGHIYGDCVHLKVKSIALVALVFDKLDHNPSEWGRHWSSKAY